MIYYILTIFEVYLYTIFKYVQFNQTNECIKKYLHINSSKYKKLNKQKYYTAYIGDKDNIYNKIGVSIKFKSHLS